MDPLDKYASSFILEGAEMRADRCNCYLRAKDFSRGDYGAIESLI
jgi:hypothetical protein